MKGESEIRSAKSESFSLYAHPFEEENEKEKEIEPSGFHAGREISGLRSSLRQVGLLLLTLVLCGCASTGKERQAEARAFQAGQESAFQLMLQSGLPVVRLAGPFQRAVIPWHEELTLAGALVAGGYLPDREPGRIVLQRGPEVRLIEPARLLAGEDFPLEPGVTIHALP